MVAMSATVIASLSGALLKEVPRMIMVTASVTSDALAAGRLLGGREPRPRKAAAMAAARNPSFNVWRPGGLKDWRRSRSRY